MCAAYFTTQDLVVSQPLYDNAPYDLIVDDRVRLQRVQCKYSNRLTHAGGPPKKKVYPVLQLHTYQPRGKGRNAWRYYHREHKPNGLPLGS